MRRKKIVSVVLICLGLPTLVFAKWFGGLLWSLDDGVLRMLSALGLYALPFILLLALIINSNNKFFWWALGISLGSLVVMPLTLAEYLVSIFQKFPQDRYIIVVAWALCCFISAALLLIEGPIEEKYKKAHPFLY